MNNNKNFKTSEDVPCTYICTADSLKVRVTNSKFLLSFGERIPLNFEITWTTFLQVELHTYIRNKMNGNLREDMNVHIDISLWWWCPSCSTTFARQLLTRNLLLTLTLNPKAGESSQSCLTDNFHLVYQINIHPHLISDDMRCFYRIISIKVGFCYNNHWAIIEWEKVSCR